MTEIETETETEELMVRYVGDGTLRIITSEEWERLGAPNLPTTEWNFANGFKIPASQFPKAAMRYFAIDDRFEVS